MAYELRDMGGSMFKNKDKKEGDNRPNVTGECMVDGVAYYVSAWTKKDKNGNPWQSLAFKKKEKQQAAKPQSEGSETEDDSVPF